MVRELPRACADIPTRSLSPPPPDEDHPSILGIVLGVMGAAVGWWLKEHGVTEFYDTCERADAYADAEPSGPMPTRHPIAF
jgi:hypothetical protein